MKTMIVLSLFAVAYFSVGSASAAGLVGNQQIDTPAGTFYLVNEDTFGAGVAQESNDCEGFQGEADAEECAAGTPADTIIIEHDFA